MEKVLESGVLIPYLSPFENFVLSLTCRSALCMRPKIEENDDEENTSRDLITTDGRREWLSGEFPYAGRKGHRIIGMGDCFDRPRRVEAITILERGRYFKCMRSLKCSAVYDDRGKHRRVLTDIGCETLSIKDHKEITVTGTVCIRKEGIRLYESPLEYIVNREADVTVSLLTRGLAMDNHASPRDLIYDPDLNYLPIEFGSNSFTVKISKKDDVGFLLTNCWHLDTYNGTRRYSILPYCGSEYIKVVYQDSYLEGQTTGPYEPADSGSEDYELAEAQLKDTFTLGISWNTYRHSYGGEYSIRSIKVSEEYTTIKFTKAKLFDNRLFYIDVHSIYNVTDVEDRYLIYDDSWEYVMLDIYAPKGLVKEQKGEYSRYYILE